MIRPENDDDEIHDALAIVLSEQRDSTGSLSTDGGIDTSSVSDELDSRRIENALRQLARYRDELKESPATLAPPVVDSNSRSIGRFEILRELGRGGCGVVFLVRDPDLSRLIALKVPHPAALVSPELQRRFLIEARAAAGLEHPNIIRVYEVGNTGPISWIASEYCAGCTLQTYLERSQTNLNPRAAAQLIWQLALAIDYAHQRGILHRDLKPANILLDGQFGDPEMPKSRQLPPLEECQPKLTDFGLAKILNEAQDATMTQFPMGTPAYMSPEQIAGNGSKIGVASDCYSLGIILYELLTGVSAFRGSSRTETWRQILQEDPKSIALFRADVPLDLQAIVRRATEKKQTDRYQTAADLAADLQRFLVGEQTLARPLGLLSRGVRWVRRHPAASGMISIVVAAVLLLFAGGYWHLHKIEDELRINRELRATGETQLDELRHVAYLRNLEIADSSLSQTKLAAAIASLEESLPQPGEVDRRNFVWHHLWNRCHHEAYRVGHHDTVSALAFSPDGKILASGEHNDRIHITEVGTGKVLHLLVGHRGNINALAFHGEQLLSAADDGNVFIWDSKTGEKIGNISCHEGDILCMAVHPNKPWIATGGVDSVLRLWDLDTKQLLKEFVGEPEWLRGVGFSPDGKSLLSTGHEQRLRCWEIETGKLHWITENVRGKLHALAIKPDNDTIFVGGHSGVVYQHRLSDGELVDEIITNLTWIRGLAYNDKTKELAVCANTGHVGIWDTAKPFDKPPDIDFAAHQEPIWSIAYAPDGKLFATGGTDKLLKVWHNDINRQRGFRTWQLGKLYGQRDLRVNFQNGMVLLVSPDGWVAVNLREFGSSVITRHDFLLDHAQIDSEMKRCAVVNYGQPLAILEGFDRQEHSLKSLGYTCSPGDVTCWHPDGKRLGILSLGRNLVFWDVEQDESCGEYPVSQELEPMSLALSPNGRYAALHFNNPRQVQLLDLQTREILWNSPSIKVRPIFSADSKYLATGFSEETIKIFDLEQRREIGRFSGKARELCTLAFTPDNKTIAAGYVDSTIQFWDIRTGTLVIEVPTKTGIPAGIYFSPDQRQMLVHVVFHSRNTLCYYADFRKPYPH